MYYSLPESQPISESEFELCSNSQQDDIITGMRFGIMIEIETENAGYENDSMREKCIGDKRNDIAM